MPANVSEKRNTTMSGAVSSPTNDMHPPLSISIDSSSDAASERSNMNDAGSSGLFASSASGSGPSPIASLGEVSEQLYTTRFKHVTTDEGHYVITGRDGVLQTCEDEPIHTPGAVQSFGLLVALKEDSEGRFPVHVVSENSRHFLGVSPQQLFKLDSFLDIFSEEQAENILDHIDFIRDEDADIASNGPEVFSISIRPPKERSIKLWCAMHINLTNPDMIICEFELEEDHEHPLRPVDEITPPAPEDTLYQLPTLEEFNESTEVGSKPLRVLRSARKKRGEAGAMQVFDIMSQVQEQLASATDLDKFLKILVGIVKELTGFHRVMIYQFDSSYNGKVVTELVDPTHTRDLYKGLYFPASDIPRQARELYKTNKVRLLYDRDLESARLVCRTQVDMEQPLDLTHSYLRAMSPIHLKYLSNMAVRASMSISINAFSELWGLIACHSYGPRGMRVAFPIRKMCRLVGDTASRNIERLSYASRLQARKLINTVPTDKNPSGYIIASSDDLLRLFDADFGMLSIRGETKILGKLEQTQEALALIEYLRLKKFSSVVTTQDIGAELPDLRYPPGFSVIAGMLYVPLSVRGQDFIVFFRKGQVKEVRWAGNPYEKVIQEGTSDYLEPRTSFQVWHETVIGKCREWSEEQVETAAVLCLVYGKFIEVWREKEQALQKSRLTRLLLANSAHEVRTPLNAIINYLEIALEGSLDGETRDNLSKSHSASKSLIYVINDLLDLTKIEEGQNLVKDEVIDLPACLKEATEPFTVDAKRKGISYSVIEHPGLPRMVHGDHRRVRQAIANMTANAVEHTTKGSVTVECFVTEVVDSRCKIEIVVQDTGRGMSDAKLDALFQELEQVSTVEGLDDEIDKPVDNRALGLGLAVVARIVRNMDGQLRLKSEEGLGSRFVIQLPFDLPEGSVPEQTDSNKKTRTQAKGAPSVASVTKSLPPIEDGEVTLVDRGSAMGTDSPSRTIRHRRSFDETGSIQSLRSATSKGSTTSNRSDADRLIDALSTPLAYGEGDPDSVGLQRRSSKNSIRSSHSAGARYSPTEGGHPGRHPPEVVRQERPGLPSRSTTVPSNQLGLASSPGMAHVKDSKTPIKPIKVPEEFSDMPPSAPQPDQTRGVLFEISDQPHKDSAATQSKPKSSVPDSSEKLKVLIAEDDPVNSRILRKRLEKASHEVVHTVNGEDCATVFSEDPQTFEVVLMDMQMPIVDGLNSAKMIRAFEQSDKCSGLSPLAQHYGRVPIFAVSASLLEREMTKYVDAGFDGWILKPIDFKRLNVLLEGISNDAIRQGCLYAPGEWERGGWFESRSNEDTSTGTGTGS
ncbi:putative cyanobacterial phytochrome B [Truncatella angustata]|uniref:Cyanobacterial phytochrome B n=1 Tax=Truncatella angustata TaxID=152316 RepID=A0A9P8UDG9_9PEZI|nr:putative cyanobacterial phytochrome B [Truncatella angustata]KAH6647499.1 putative cyanobacterial phytochrome B [Truncatella angustata]